MGKKYQKLRDSARGQECTFNLPNVCCYDIEKSMLCHLSDASGTGIRGGKTDDFIAAIGCFFCHQVLDMVDMKNYELLKEDLPEYIRIAHIRTLQFWVREGYIEIK